MSESQSQATVTETPDSPAISTDSSDAKETHAARNMNRVEGADEAETVASVRQVEEFAERLTGSAEDSPAQVPSGLMARLRGLVGGTRDGEVAGRPAGQDGDDEIPGALRQRYAIHVSDDRKSVSLFEPGAKMPAITLDAKSISTPHSEGVVVADVVALARDRGWQALKVAGTPEFKDALWLEASKAGLSVQHVPSAAVAAHFAKWQGQRPDSKVEQAPAPRPEGGPNRRGEELARAFGAKSAEERLADPNLRNAQLELMVGIRTAEKELGRKIGEMPDVLQALSATVRQQLADGRIFEAPFVKPDGQKRAAKPVQNPKIDADRIPPPRQ